MTTPSLGADGGRVDIRSWSAGSFGPGDTPSVPVSMVAMEVDPNGLEVLGRSVCLELLGTVPFGRLGLSIDALPVVLPVSFVVDGDDLEVVAVGDDRLGAALTGAVVAFQADGRDPTSGVAWSVLVRGCSTRVETAGRVDGLSLLHPGLWGERLASHLATITTDLVSGRRLR